MQVMRDRPDAQLFACRVDPLFSSGPVGYVRGVVEWFDAVTQFGQHEWMSGTGAGLARALVVRKEVFARLGYFEALGQEAAAAERVWARRVIAAGMEVAFCGDARVYHETVKSVAALRAKLQRAARGDLILTLLESGETYGVRAIFRDAWSVVRTRTGMIRDHKHIPRRFVPGVLLISLWSFVWTARTMLRYRQLAQRTARRHRQKSAASLQPGTNAGRHGVPLPLRWLGARLSARRLRAEEAPERTASN
jgi:hypothetical protein